MTVLTIQWACQNSVNSERSEEVSGSTDCATSAGFMGTSSPLDPALETLARDLSRKPVPTFRDHALVGQTGAAHHRRNKGARPAIPLTPATEYECLSENPLRPAAAGPNEIPAKLDQT